MLYAANYLQVVDDVYCNRSQINKIDWNSGDGHARSIPF